MVSDQKDCPFCSFKISILVDWANKYADSVKGDRGGSFPNPYKFAFGES